MSDAQMENPGNGTEPAHFAGLVELVGASAAPVAPAIWAAQPPRETDACCPICRAQGMIFLVVEDLAGECWGVISGCHCADDCGGLLRLELAQRADVRPGPASTTFRLFQGASDRRYEQTEDLLAHLSVEAAVAAVRQAVSTLEPSDAPGQDDDRIGGGLDAYSDAIIENPALAPWFGKANWVTLCVLDFERIDWREPGDVEADVLVSVVDPADGTGVWSLS